jgi:hypothetical protein
MAIRMTLLIKVIIVIIMNLRNLFLSIIETKILITNLLPFLLITFLMFKWFILHL